uniref:Uncharacterized protein n=1 Tax=Hordeum vulgare subsp. vulgare TaxID=112509 RepID=A0A8I7B9G7_HORVV
MLRMDGGGEASDYGSSEAGIYEHEEELEHHLRVSRQEHPGGVDGDGDDDLKAEGEGKGEDEGEDELSEAPRRSSTRRRSSIRMGRRRTWSQS